MGILTTHFTDKATEEEAVHFLSRQVLKLHLTLRASVMPVLSLNHFSPPGKFLSTGGADGWTRSENTDCSLLS